MVMSANWQNVWSNFDSRRNAKVEDGANDVVDAQTAAANEPDMFGGAGVAAEQGVAA